MAKAMRLQVGQKCDPGRARGHNEDRVSVYQPADPTQAELKGDFYAVADGMGGREAGAVAADRATRKVTDEYYYSDPTGDVRESLERAIQAANTAVRDLMLSLPSWANMGTTFVGAVIRGDRLVVANVGDSRAYLIRGGSIRALTQDHTWVAEEIRANRLTPEQARTHPRRNLVTRSLGTRPEVKADVFEETLQPDDAIVLCSDGLHGVVLDEEIRDAVTTYSPQEAADELVNLANERGGPDNVSVVVVGPPRQARPRPQPAPKAPPRATAAASPSHKLFSLAGAVGLLGVAVIAYALLAGPQLPPIVASRDDPTSQATGGPNGAGASPTPVTTMVVLTAIGPHPSSTPTANAGLPAGPTATLVPVQVPSPTPVARTVAPPTLAPTQPVAPPSPTLAPAHPTRAPAPSPTATQPRQPSPTPTVAPPTATPAPQAPVLLGARAQPGSVVLSWSYPGQLAPDEYFDVQVWKTGAPPAGIANVKDTSYLIGGDFPSGDYNWTIAVVRRQSGTITELSVAASIGTFAWAGALSGTGGTPKEPPAGR